MSKQYKVFILEPENVSEIPSYLKMLQPLRWSVSSFSTPQDFLQSILSGVKPDIIIASFNISPINLQNGAQVVTISNSVDLVRVLMNNGIIGKIPTTFLLNPMIAQQQAQYCEQAAFGSLVKGNFDDKMLVQKIEQELKVLYQDKTDYLHILQFGDLDMTATSLSTNVNTTPLNSAYITATAPVPTAPVIEQHNLKKECKIVSFYNGGKGGVGKTTISTNFAVLLAESNSKVLLIDADFYSPNCYLLLQVKPTRTIIDVKHSISFLTFDTFKDNVIEHKSGLSFLAGPTNPKDVELLDAEDLFKIISLAKEHYDYIVIDLPPKLPDESPLIGTIAHLSDKIIQVTTQSYSSIEGLRKAFQLLAHEDIDPNRFGICVNQMNPKINYTPDSIAAKISTNQDYASKLKEGTIPVVGQIGSDDEIPVYESMMRLKIEDTKSKFRKDMELMVKNVFPEFKFQALANPQTEGKGKGKEKEKKSSTGFLNGLFGKKK